MTQQHWYDTEEGRKFADSAFKAAGLEEPIGVPLETGTYSNEEIARKFDDPRKFLVFLMHLENMGGSEASKRSIASITIDM
ncbi:MAG: hypothetical protein UU77_C0001G0025 [candidate division WWE3 bacterium GW2011_GWC1_41_7]|uniref:Uncharacterized protein n=4 Tax=Katanobacteria TaxID=422282 RepID=A0A0G0XDP6_UNCKA|nr:MAG: hypothetical protein UU72_C0003G0026 [candidate division WWE3 bacterium GW2011_GWB1_41_6]KKS21530.1 MAG: hypothetical protein UU77_C0001G0025 [candidate division WWE3 bacterium GW2011_GWC1_41_7]KKS22512.1 MAG: hypothetical protein UU80_C0006G0038 [candidate division WWE3 bacterium GW2011_GWA1_41_8]OGC56912.1 MAG: hypothetical protein A2976_00660 [candidate division WWE3 bacterium RIFCSPLOWO2_01_FULL_41_9]